RLVIARTRRALGVVLVAADRKRRMRETLDRSVVEVARRYDEVAVGGDRRFVDLELVVLARDHDLAADEVAHRMVRPVMAERQARGRRADRASDQLMPEADPQDGQRPRCP